MTAVLEPQAPGQSTPADTYEVLPHQPAVAAVLPEPGTPFHCGVAMTESPIPIASLGWAPLELGSSEWCCACGYRMDGGPAGDPLEAVRLASARVESIQWELDTAQERFGTALRNASRLGAGQEALSEAAGLSAAELQEFLADGQRIV
ncbi:hypothetical protein AB0284_05560 [Pseudarthrobacter phenanthrenivorans]|uniref:hypothetical protein n=1 Tax=Pseudarthrobacter phenanthrenivorans TaxID=361575 RepID=UPI001F0B608A|nr:hypothetical protein [Pseudarthrobacter phenanthrenivorans]